MPLIPVRAPVVEMSQSLVLTDPVSPLSPRVKAPFAVNVPVEVRVESKVVAEVTFPPEIVRSPSI